MAERAADKVKRLVNGELRFRVAGMDCAEEVSQLRAALTPAVPEERLGFDVLNRRLTVRVEAGSPVDADEIRRLVATTGMKAEVWTPGAPGQEAGPANRVRKLLCWLSGALVLVGYVNHALQHGFAHALAADSEGGAFPVVSIVAYAGATLAGAWFVLPKAWSALRRLRPDMNLLMVIAITGALLIGEWFEAAAVSFLFALALLLESWSVDRARRAIERLLDLSPPTAHVLRPEGEGTVEVAIESVSPGTSFVVRPGDRVPLDGLVVRGEGHIDEASLTGESVPVPKQPGDEVFAGTINAEAALEVRATRLAEDSTLARIIHMVEEAQSRRAPSERWVERFAARYTPIMMALALLVATVPPLMGLTSWGDSLYRALVLLVIACPCALVISTPVSIVAALACAARGGVLIKGGTHLETIARVRVFAMDKTGTLTRGEPVVEATELLEGHTQEEFLSWASALEARSTHPLARAIVSHADSLGIQPARSVDVRELPGLGAEGTIDGRRAWIGGHRLVHQLGVESPAAHETIAALEARGLTAVALGTESHVCGVLGIADAIRPEARGIVDRLHDLGIERVVMLTGDHQVAAERVAAATGVDDVSAGLLPQDKVHAIGQLSHTYGPTAMIGDGVNDAPALAAAEVGVAMGAAGSDVAIETADIALMSDDLARLPWLVSHARRTLRIVRQNVAWALGAKAVVMVLATLGVASLWMAIAADMGASLIVIANALRLLRT